MGSPALATPTARGACSTLGFHWPLRPSLWALLLGALPGKRGAFPRGCWVVNCERLRTSREQVRKSVQELTLQASSEGWPQLLGFYLRLRCPCGLFCAPVTFRSAPRAPHFSLSSVFQPPDLCHPIRSFITSTVRNFSWCILRCGKSLASSLPTCRNPHKLSPEHSSWRKGAAGCLPNPEAVTFKYKTLSWKLFVNALPNVSYSFENVIIWFLARPDWYVRFLFGLWRLLDFEKTQCRLESASDTWSEASNSWLIGTFLH